MSNSVKSSAIEWIKSILIALVLAFLIKTFLFNSTKVKGTSMEPTLHEKDRIFVNKIVYEIKAPQRGEIITFKAPNEKNKEYIKRIIGIPGDRVSIENGKVKVNDKEIIESYIAPNSHTHTYEKNEWTVPQGKVFVIGDNRGPGKSLDSRRLGFIDMDNIVGRAGIRYFPFNRVGDLTVLE